jgi:hypothetical protein
MFWLMRFGTSIINSNSIKLSVGNVEHNMNANAKPLILQKVEIPSLYFDVVILPNGIPYSFAIFQQDKHFVNKQKF